MNETASAETGAADPDTAHDRTLRTAAKAGALLLPTALISILLSLTTERAGRCLTYGEQCSATPGWAIFGALLASAALGIYAASCPQERLPFPTARSWAVKLQWLAQLVMAMMLLTSP